MRHYPRLVADLGALAADDAVSGDALRAGMRALLAPFEARATKSKAAAIREQLATEASALVALLGAVSTVGVDPATDHPLAEALKTLEAVTADGGRDLPVDTASPFGPTWKQLIEPPDRTAALGPRSALRRCCSSSGRCATAKPRSRTASRTARPRTG